MKHSSLHNITMTTQTCRTRINQSTPADFAPSATSTTSTAMPQTFAAQLSTPSIDNVLDEDDAVSSSNLEKELEMLKVRLVYYIMR